MRRLVAFAFCGLLAASFSTAFAGTVDFVALAGGNANGGGLFQFKVTSGLTNVVVDGSNEFVSFCMEDSEFINLPVSSYGATVNGNATGSWAIKGGGYGIGEPTPDLTATMGDPMSTVTATLFKQFTLNPLTINGWTGTATDGTSLNNLQMALWYVEHELNNDTAHAIPGPVAPMSDPNLKFGPLSADAQKMVLWGVANDPGNIQDVRVLNLTFPNGTLAQDQLVLVTHDSFVPVPAALWAGMSLLVGMITVRGVRRMRAE